MAVAWKMGATVDDDKTQLTVVRIGREISQFPAYLFRKAIMHNGSYCPNTRPDPVPMGSRTIIDLRWSALERISGEEAQAVTAVTRAFIENRVRHKVHGGHWLVWMAMEIGMERKADGRGNPTWEYRHKDKSGVLTEEETARAYGLDMDTVARYLRAANKAVDDEWRALHFYQG